MEKLHRLYRVILIVFLTLLWCSCSVKRFIPKGKLLYTEGVLHLNIPDTTRDIALIKKELNAIIQPAPNTKILGMRLGLYYHYKAQQEKPGFITKWLEKKLGEEPVYLSDVRPKRIEELLQNRLENRGFFYPAILSETDSTKKFAKIIYNVTLSAPYVLKTYTLDADSLAIYKEIEKLMETTPVKPGMRFDLQLLEFERKRIDNILKQKGYYNFNADFLIFEADTNRYANRKFDLFLRLKKNTPEKAVIPYRIDTITVYPHYTIDKPQKTSDTSQVNDLIFIQEKTYFKPRLLAPYILFRKGQKYNAHTAKLTSNRLSSIGSYKFVNIKFRERDSLSPKDHTGRLAAEITLSPLTKRSLRAALQAVTKSNGFAGPGVALTYRNRNLFHGGETLRITGSVAYEMQLTDGDRSGLSSVAGDLKTTLVFPRLLPFSLRSFHYAVPNTEISLGISYLNRSKLYSLNSFSGSFGYTWNANRFVYHELNPLSIDYVNLFRTTAAFENILEQNPFLQQSFKQQFIAGLKYRFTYNGLIDKTDIHSTYVSVGLDVAGNMLQLISGRRKTFLGLEYAQYAKADIDFRYYFRFGKEQAMVTRIFAGLGLPYGNSATLPFVKQYFSGGPYSVRAFKIRALGPGTYTSSGGGTFSFFDQSGNVRLEANAEYRFPLFSYLKGAVFADAGNVWLTGGDKKTEDGIPAPNTENEALILKGTFSKNWFKELGIGMGVGLRIDVQNFVIRFDLATPLYVPYMPEGERWNGIDINPKNMVLNFAIGYPF